ncbi:MAG: hypothetical protein J2O48_05200 [Solirubrobacterales bacterium]|nr:hypothetical protein [Solirubrobacterales bacterium]
MKGKDTSWHWTWECDASVTMHANSKLYIGNWAIAGSFSKPETGIRGSVNIRYNGCADTWWKGGASGFETRANTIPGHFADKFSPYHKITNCPGGPPYK